MDIKQELNYKLFMQREENVKHLEYEKEFGFYKAIASGNMKEVLERHKEYEKTVGYTNTQSKNGVLSQNPLQNQKFHFVILAAMITRFCVESGLERETAYNMSDIFIQRVDLCTSIPQINELQLSMVVEYTTLMQENRKRNVYSRQITKCIDYIYDNLHHKPTVNDIAEYLRMTPAYLSKLFAKEVKMPLSTYIKEQRITAAANMLQYTDYSISEISEYFEFSSQSHFTSAFQSMYGLTPKKYRDKYAVKSMPHT